jgi:predicted amidophosphoribosyltransferase
VTAPLVCPGCGTGGAMSERFCPRCGSPFVYAPGMGGRARDEAAAARAR